MTASTQLGISVLTGFLLGSVDPQAASAQEKAEVLTQEIPDIDLASPTGDVLDLTLGRLSTFDRNRGEDGFGAALLEAGDLAYDWAPVRSGVLLIPAGEYAVLSEQDLAAAGTATYTEKRQKRFTLEAWKLAKKDYIVLRPRSGGEAALFVRKRTPSWITVSWVGSQSGPIDKERIEKLIDDRRKADSEGGRSDSFGFCILKNLAGKSPTGFDFQSRRELDLEASRRGELSRPALERRLKVLHSVDLKYTYGLGPLLEITSHRSALLGKGSLKTYVEKDLRAIPLQSKGHYSEPELAIGAVILMEALHGDFALIRIETLTKDATRIRFLLDADGDGKFKADAEYWSGEVEAAPAAKKEDVPPPEADVHRSVRLGSLDEVRTALARGALVDEIDQYGYAPLHYAAAKGDLEKCKLLVENGADPGATTKDGLTPLQVALRSPQRNPAVIEYLKALRGFGTLLEAAEAGSLAAVKELIARGADVNEVDRSRKSALHYAAENGFPGIIDVLLENGADPALRAVQGDLTPLSLAAVVGQVDSVESLLASGRIEEQDKAKALHEAGIRGYAAASRALLEAGADPTLKLEEGIVPLQEALLYAPKAVVETYMESGVEIPVWAHARLGLVGHLKEALRAGQDPNASNSTGTSALHWASRAGQVEAVEVLLQAGASVSASGKSGTTPLHEAVEANNEKIVELLLSRGTDVNAVNQEGRTPLYLAVLHKHPGIVKQLLQARADPNIVPQYEVGGTIHRKSLLDIAGRYEEIQRLLRNAGAR